MPRIQINMIGTSDRVGASWLVTSQWAIATLPSAAAMATALANLRTALAASTAFKTGIPSNYSLVSLKALGYTVPTGPADWSVDATGAPIAGTNSPGHIPLAVVVSEQTGSAGASNRGRSYWPASDFDLTTGGVVGVSQQSQVRASWLAFHSAAVTALSPLGGTPVHVVFSRKTGNLTPINVIRTGNRVDTARGRFGDAPELYNSAAVPGTTQLTAEPVEPNDVSPSAIGLPDDTTPEELANAIAALQQYMDADYSDEVRGIALKAARTLIEAKGTG